MAYGRVQGVGFRDFVRRHALQLGLSGYVRNRPDGTVQVEAAGPAPALARLHELLMQGPPHAAVERLENHPPGPDALPTPFTIRH